MTREILTLREVAQLLRIGVKTAYTMAKDAKLPGFKVGGQWRFRRVDIDAWIRARLGTAPKAAAEGEPGSDLAVAGTLSPAGE